MTDEVTVTTEEHVNRTAAVAFLFASPLAFAETNAFEHLDLGGYVQGRYVYSESSGEGLSAAGRPNVTDGFTVRRGRLKATYALDGSKYVLQIDATGKGVALKDAEVHLVEPWTGQKLELVVGQTKYPFGFEVGQSSSVRELPERTRVVRAFLAGERDRGAKLLAHLSAVRVMVGVFDGNGTDNAGFEGVDNDQNKDVIGRVGVDFGFLSAGVSGWYGRTFRSNTYDAAGAVAVPGRTFDRTRIGADLQLEGKVLPIGGTELRAEFIAGRTYMKSGVEQFGVPALGWYAVLVQHLGEDDFVAVRYDHFDPVAGTPDAAAGHGGVPASGNGVGTVGVAVGHQWNQSVKLSAAYEVPLTGGPAGVEDPSDNLLTLQLQAKF